MKIQTLATSIIAILTISAALVTAALGQTSNQERAKISEIWEPVPPMVTPGSAGSPPSDAIVLFDGRGLSSWESVEGGAAAWAVEDGAMKVNGKGGIQTKQAFGDIQLHIEWRTPSKVEGTSQGRGNSGVFLAGRYEVQVLDSYDNPTYSNGQAGSVYKQHIPLVNASRGPGQWQSYDVIFMAPHFGDSGRVVRPATTTVFHNGVLVLNSVTIQGATAFIGEPLYQAHGKAPIMLQDHRNPVSFRNIWVREL